MSEYYADLAIPVAVNKLFTYLVPDELRQSARSGVRAVVPFGKRTVVGIIIDTGPTPGNREEISTGGRYRSIREVLDLEPVLTEDLLSLSRWMANYYCAPLSEILKSVLSVNAARAGKRTAVLCRVDVENILSDLSAGRAQASPASRGSRTSHGSPASQISIVRELAQRGKVSVSRLQTMLKIKRISPALNALVARGIVRIEEEVLSAGMKPRTESIVRIDEERRRQWNLWLAEAPAPPSARGTAKQRALIGELLSINAGEAGEVTVSAADVLRKTGTSRETLNILQRRGLLTIETREIFRSPDYDLYASSLGAQNIVLNPRQREAAAAISACVTEGRFKTFLLFGVTGSGKTQVYIESIRTALALGKSVIVLVPEISLTPQIVRRFKQHFGAQVVVQHSRMSAGERYDVWRAAREGRVSVVIGPRSAVFAPLKNLGLIVVDEEQEPSYKQYDQSPHYHARDVAIIRARGLNAVVVLGSATPSFESYSNGLSGKYDMLVLPERVDNARLPEIEIVDMTIERKMNFEAFRAQRKADFISDPARARTHPRKFQPGSLSELLKGKIADRLRKKEGVIILQNRRGFAPFIECYACGHVETCPNCSISLTYHLVQKNLRCHYCGLAKPVPDTCPKCSSTDIEYRGFGTQRVEEEIRELFPGVRMLRMDRDTTGRKNAHDLILRRFSEGDVDVLLGTQMVAKGLDISRVTLVGVISADTQMLLPDFRSSEHTFQLLAQVAGRAGRSKLPGEVVIQTYLPRHMTLKHVLTHDFKAFYEAEVESRRQLAYPPFSRLVLIEFKGKEEGEVFRSAAAFASSVRSQSGQLLTLGPAPPAVARLKGLFRCHVLLKDPRKSDSSGRAFRAVLEKALNEYGRTAPGKSRSVSITVDVDPVGMM